MADPAEGFRTERLLARPWEPTDAPRMFDMLRRVEVAKWTSTPEPMTDIAEAHQKIERWREPVASHPRLGIWAIVPDEVGMACGTILLRPLENSDAIEIGWSLHPDVWGRGYASEAAAGALAHAFVLGHDHVIAIMWPDNHPSAAVCRRIGMTELGIVEDPWHGTPQDPTSLMFEARRSSVTGS